MNVLGFTIIFISVISLISFSLFRSSVQLEYLAHQHTKYLQLERNILNKLENVALPSTPNDSESSGRVAQARDTKPYKSHRYKQEILESSKLNISSLFTAGKEPNLPLKKILIRLLTILYQDKHFFNEERLESCVHEIIEKGKTCSAKELTDLYPNSLENRDFFYMMLKSETPLGNFVTLSTRKGRKPVHIKYASYQLLCACFDEEIATQILEIEKANYYEAKNRETSPIKENQFLDLLNRYHMSSPDLSFFGFDSPGLERKTYLEQDQTMHFSIDYSVDVLKGN